MKIAIEYAAEFINWLNTETTIDFWSECNAQEELRVRFEDAIDAAAAAERKRCADLCRYYAGVSGRMTEARGIANLLTDVIERVEVSR